MSLVRRHLAKHAALQAAAASSQGDGLATIVPATVASPADGQASSPPPAPIGAEAQLAMTRLRVDLQRLKEIQSVERKIDAKRLMLPEYDDYIAGLLAAAREAGAGVTDEVLPTVMVWRIDVGDYQGALDLADYVLRWSVPLPHRYQRAAATLVTEEIADAALKLLPDAPFDLDVLFRLDELVADEDMHDQVRAKLKKAIGLELARRAATDPGESAIAGEVAAAQRVALDQLKRALALNPKAGVKKQIDTLERAIAKQPDAEAAGGQAPPADIG
ncbi:phage terminase small subunit [Sphingomonas sp.]|uniref:phage terminase small subunit n=1 Tax=Sphingomonas sp. TaxID=28214 RepID=UPI003B3B43B6